MSHTNTSTAPAAELVAELNDALARAKETGRAYHQIKAEAAAELTRVTAEIESRVTVARAAYSRATAELNALLADEVAA